MDNKNHFTVVLPLSDTELAMLRQEPSLTDLRATLWNRAADSMKPLLGRICSRISPAVLPGLPPYSVALGRTEPHAFLMCYLAAREAQEKELEEKIRREKMKEEEAEREKSNQELRETVFAATTQLASGSQQAILNLQTDVKTLIQDQIVLDVDMKGLRVNEQV